MAIFNKSQYYLERALNYVFDAKTNVAERCGILFNIDKQMRFFSVKIVFADNRARLLGLKLHVMTSLKLLLSTNGANPRFT